MASSPRIVVSTVTQRILSPQPAKNFLVRKTLSPRSPATSPNRNLLSIDTPNRVRIVNDGPPRVEDHSILGSGGFGTVYRASYKGGEVAAKIVRRRRKSDAAIKAEKNAVSLVHLNIIRIFGIEEGSACSLITMELCGTSLQDKLDDTSLTRVERINTWCAIAAGLEFCHNAGIVHADVKPKNVLISADGQPKLADFGSSITIGEIHSSSRILRGTPGYVAPEVIKGSTPTEASDVYSLGVLAWQLLSRQSPFSGYHAHTILYLTGVGARPCDELLDDECSGSYKKLYKMLWSESPETRPSLKTTIDCLSSM